MSDSCYACGLAEDLASVTQAIHVEDGWRVAHAFNTSLPGWLVLVTLRHVTAVHELTAAEAAAMGVLLKKCSAALQELTGCSKSYFMFFAEAEGFSHLHVHVVPRMDWFSREQRGPHVFTFMNRDEEASLPMAEQERLARELRAILARTD